MNKQLRSLALLAFLLSLFTQQSFGQASGVKPELIMYRHNSSPNSSPMPVVVPNILGTLKWNGLTSIGAIRTGASIRSTTKFVSPGMLSADMIFSTSHLNTLNDRMIILETGLVGIGTMTPEYHLHVVGNTHTSGDFYGRIHFDNFSPTDDAPNTYHDEAYFERKLRSTLNVPPAAGVNNFGGILSLAPGGGAHDHQLFFGQDGIWNRREAGNDAAWTAAWEKLLTSADIKGTPNRIARFLPPDNPSSKLGDSQLFDDGTDVGIGTVTPDAAYLLTVGGDTRITGRTHVDQSLEVGNDLQVSSDADVDGNANVDGNTNLAGTLDVSNNTHLKAELDVDGQSNFDQRVKIGAGNYGTGYMLSVGGKVIAEEVRVALQGAWPDYVFDSNQPKPDPKEWAKFIQENKHLPGVPSAAEVQAAGGIELGENQRILLEKIEQLTLMVIDQQQQIETLRAELKSVKH